MKCGFFYNEVYLKLKSYNLYTFITFRLYITTNLHFALVLLIVYYQGVIGGAETNQEGPLARGLIVESLETLELELGKWVAGWGRDHRVCQFWFSGRRATVGGIPHVFQSQ